MNICIFIYLLSFFSLTLFSSLSLLQLDLHGGASTNKQQWNNQTTYTIGAATSRNQNPFSCLSPSPLLTSSKMPIWRTNKHHTSFTSDNEQPVKSQLIFFSLVVELKLDLRWFWCLFNLKLYSQEKMAESSFSG